MFNPLCTRIKQISIKKMLTNSLNESHSLKDLTLTFDIGIPQSRAFFTDHGKLIHTFLSSNLTSTLPQK